MDMQNSSLDHVVSVIEAGPLADHPGPVFAVNEKGEAVANNMPAIPYAMRYSEGALPSITAIVEAVLGGAGTQTLKISDDENGATIDFAAIPIPERQGVLMLGRDVSLDHNLRNALVDSRQRYKDLVEISSEFAWETDQDGVFVFVSTVGAMGYDPQELVGKTADSFLITPRGTTVVSPFTTREPLNSVEMMFRRADGKVAWLEASAAPLLGPEGEFQGARGVFRDLTEVRERDAALAKARNRERLTNYITRAIRDEVEPDKMLAAAARAVARATEASGCQLLRIVAGEGLVPAVKMGADLPQDVADHILSAVTDTKESVVLGDESGEALGHQLTYHAEMNGAVLLWRTDGSDAWDDEVKQLLDDVAFQLGIAIRQFDAHEHLRLLSSTDAMTGLLNRRAFNDALGQRLNSSSEVPGTLTYVDLDNFKSVNDVRGHQVGDQALIHLSEILKRQQKEGDLVARLGGDEFAMWMEGVDEAAAGGRAEWIIETGKELLQYSGSEEKPVGLSIGMAVYAPGSGEDYDALIQRSDEVMYEVKHGGKGWYRIAKPAAN